MASDRNTEKIKGILFDFGDTLVHFGKVDVTSLFEAGARQAYDYLRSLGQPLPSFSAFHRRQLWAVRWNYLKSRITRREFNAADLIGRFSEKIGQRLTGGQLAELSWLWYEPLGRCATVENGLGELLTGFRDRKMTLGIVSNTFVPGESLDRHLAALGLLELLPVRVYSCDVRYRKPNSNIFLEALGRAGLKPRQTMFVGDSLLADVMGANRLGMVSVLLDPLDRHKGSEVAPRYRIRRLADLPGIVERHNAGVS